MWAARHRTHRLCWAYVCRPNWVHRRGTMGRTASCSAGGRFFLPPRLAYHVRLVETVSASFSE